MYAGKANSNKEVYNFKVLLASSYTVVVSLKCLQIWSYAIKLMKFPRGHTPLYGLFNNYSSSPNEL